MIYFCIYHPVTKLTDCEKSFPDSEAAQAALEWPLWPLECQNRGGGWQAYQGEQPFEFPALVAVPADPEAIPTTSEVVEETPDA